MDAMSIVEKSESRTPPQRRLLKTDVPGVYRRGDRYVAITQYRGKRVKSYHRTKAEARRAKAHVRRARGRRGVSRSSATRGGGWGGTAAGPPAGCGPRPAGRVAWSLTPPRCPSV